MNSILVSLTVFACVFAAAIIGMVVRVPEDHIGADAKEVVRLATGLVATMAALVLGMLVSSAKSSYDARKNDVAEMSYEILAIDRILAKFGPDANELRSEFRQTVEFGLDRIWPKAASQQADLKPADRGQALVNELESLSPKDDRQTAAQTQAASMIVALRQTQWLLFLKTEQNAVPLPLLVVLVAWLAAIFLSFGLFAAPNATTVATLALSALAVSAALFIILEMYTPFSGVLRISPAPILDALGQMGR
jgi:Protein of unknown function (DUF4239)